MNFPDAVNRRARIMAEKAARQGKPSRCRDCGEIIGDTLTNWCKPCHAKRVAAIRAKSELPVGRQSSPEADELRELLEVGPSVLCKTTGGGTRVVRSTRGM